MTAVVREDFLGGARATRLASSLGLGTGPATVLPGGLDTWTPVVHGRIPVIIGRGLPNEEHLYATGVSGNTLTGLVRGQDGTTEQAHAANETVEHGLFASHVDAPNRFLSAPTAAGQVAVSDGADSWGTPTSTLADLTLSNPTLTSPNVGAAEWGDAQHAHGAASQGGVLPGGTPTTSAVADTPAAGTGGTYSTADHRHGREGFGPPAISSPSDTTSAGAALTVARSDHRHQREEWGTNPAASAPGDTASAGSVGRVARQDHRHAREAFASPARLEATVNNTIGTAGTVPRSDHLHGLPIQAGVAAYSLSGASGTNVTITFDAIFAANPVMQLTLQNSSGIRLNVNLTSVTTLGAVARVDHVDGTSVSTAGDIHWTAYGTLS